jgi:hypothetical protein
MKNKINKPIETISLPVGRFLLDVPRNTLFGNWYQVYFGTGRISVKQTTSFDEFKSLVDERANNLLSIEHKEGGTQLIENIKLKMVKGNILIYWVNEFFKSDLVKADDFALIKNSLYKFDGETWTDPKEKEKYIQFVNKMFGAIRPLEPDEIPKEHGFCFEHSILRDKPRPQISERVIATGIWGDHPDVPITFASLTNNEHLDPPLLQRLKQSGHSSGTKVLRSGFRSMASGEVGEEHLIRVRDRNGVRRHLFIWEAQGRPDYQYEHPQLRLDMSTGNGRQGPEDSSLTDEDALKVWDTMVNSIRLRPVEQAN